MSRLKILALALILSFTTQLHAQNPTRDAVELIATLSGHTKSILEITFSPRGRSLASGKELLTLQVPEGISGGVFWSPRGEKVAIMGYEFHTRVFDTATGRETGRLPYGNCWPWQMCGSDDCEPLRFSADGTVLLKEKEPIKLWDAGTVTLIKELKNAHLPAIFSPVDSQLLATRSEDKRSVLLWRVKR